MKIAILLNMTEDIILNLKQRLPNHQISQISPKDPKIFEKIKEMDVIVGANVDEDVLNNSDSLKLFQVPWVGVDRVNFKKLQDMNNVLVCNSKWNDRIVAEYALTLLLTLMKQIIPVHSVFKKGSWQVRSLKSRQLTSSKVLLIGYGSIGKEIAKLLQPFTTNIVVLRNYPEKSTQDDQVHVERIIGWDDYYSVIKDVDYVINSLPLTPETENILNGDRLKSMNKSTLFINVGRGKTVNEKALFEALKNKEIAGAGLDVWYNYKQQDDSEPFYPSSYPFHELENVILSPHRSATFRDTPETVWDDTVFNVMALENGKPLKNIVDKEKQY